MMKNWQKITGVFIGVSIFAWIFWDIFVIAKSGKEASISWQLINYFYEYPSASFLFGYVAGHLTWRMKKPEVSK